MKPKLYSKKRIEQRLASIVADVEKRSPKIPVVLRGGRMITREQFLGAQMANLLWSIGHGGTVMNDTRHGARELCEKWDSIATFRLDNPIVAAELEAQLFPRSTR